MHRRSSSWTRRCGARDIFCIHALSECLGLIGVLQSTVSSNASTFPVLLDGKGLLQLERHGCRAVCNSAEHEWIR
eukprot:5372667-Amphidinium_carterae.1